MKNDEKRKAQFRSCGYAAHVDNVDRQTQPDHIAPNRLDNAARCPHLHKAGDDSSLAPELLNQSKRIPSPLVGEVPRRGGEGCIAGTARTDQVVRAF